MKISGGAFLQVALAGWVGRFEKPGGAAAPGGSLGEDVWGAAAERENQGGGGGAGL